MLINVLVGQIYKKRVLCCRKVYSYSAYFLTDPLEILGFSADGRGGILEALDGGTAGLRDSPGQGRHR